MNGSIEIQEAVLVGILVSLRSLSGSIRSNGNLIGNVQIATSYENYTGSYDIVPKIESQVLETADKHMVNDVIVQAIPYYSVSNEQNGETIIIGGPFYG